MMDRETALLFKGKDVGIVRDEGGQTIFSKGTIIDVTQTCVLLLYKGNVQAISLNALNNIREMDLNDHNDPSRT